MTTALLRCCLIVVVAIVAVLSCAPSARADDIGLRIPLDEDLVAELGQDERWAFADAQKLLFKQQWKPAAIAFHKYCNTYPDSALWTVGAYCEAFAIRRDERLNAAISRLDEIMQVDTGSPELAEILLLQGECWQDSGELGKAQKIFQRIVEQFAASTAIVPARVRLDDCVANLATQQGMEIGKIVARRLAVLAPLAEDLKLDDLNGWWYARAFERLRDLAMQYGQVDKAIALARGLAKVAQGCRHFDVHGFRNDLYRRVYHAAVSAGDDALSTQLAGEAWPDAVTRAQQSSQIRIDVFQAVLDNQDVRTATAKARGVKPDELVKRTREQLVALAGELTTAAEALPADGRRNELTWSAVRAGLLGGEAGATLALLERGLGRALNAGEARQFADWGFNRGHPVPSLRAAVDRVAEGRERTMALLLMCDLEAYRNPDQKERPLSAQQAIGLAAKFESELPERQAEFLRIQARLTEEILGDFKGAIVLFTKLNQPPGTDFDVARCLEKMGDNNAAFLKYGEIYATCSKDGNGAEALWRQGVMANEKLNERAKAILILRQVCDEFPGSGQYGNAHNYLQQRLDTVYTGGGGKRER